MKKSLLLPFFLFTTLFPSSIYASERRLFVDTCSSQLVGIYTQRSSRKICDCAYDYWKATGDAESGGYYCALQHGVINY